MKIKSYLLIILIVISAVGLSVCSYIYTPEKYQEFSAGVDKEPVMAPMLKGATAGVYPWSPEEKQEESQPKAQTTEEEKPKPEAKIEVVEPKSFTKVEDSYFDDAVFIGDSRMVGLSQYCPEIDSRATFFAKKSLTIYNLQKDAWIDVENGPKETLFEALSKISFSKVYIMVGINEIGRGTNETYHDAYADVINRILEIQPDALIFINSTMHVTKEKSEGDPLYNNGNINVRNAALFDLIDYQHIFYLNVNDMLDDGEGNLDDSLSGDGVHLKGSCYEPWHQYLLFNGVVD
ncbi:GDSL-like Lipase/Acylhydrolase family protein [Pseudobutyrivibrio sp. 49]|uniref:GDSL-type esterase/lipase family protein n=1 Tax=unclassified Pseudobutyrivibrio TaxID=2638619 RepID=UPI00089236C3|nr:MULTISPECIES: GDSL-type esterase/lipase family protein [unclassified Pseudobutyrivibrio]SDI29660.1 GDSL-like Lipase/Acylhydrolase family protein [Pseudobutyrivibrio sp. 49]SFN84360.1 GDSL-like Lipase/Acylhydrolase family [Pseudobutyrivibrio sp. UC1225]